MVLILISLVILLLLIILYFLINSYYNKKLEEIDGFEGIFLEDLQDKEELE